MKNWLRAQPAHPATLTDLQAMLDTFADTYNTRRPTAHSPPRPPDRRVMNTIPLNVSQGRGGNAVRGAGGAAGVQHVGAGYPSVGGKRENAAGVVVQPGQDLGARAAGERAAGEV
jgi:hypothetical protein